VTLSNASVFENFVSFDVREKYIDIRSTEAKTVATGPYFLPNTDQLITAIRPIRRMLAIRNEY
jgi:hypothetical protein